MQINRVNNIDNNLDSKGCRPSFTAVLRTRVYMDNVECAQSELIKKTIVKFNNVLKGPAGKNPKELGLIQKFARVIKDYSYTSGVSGTWNTSVPTRNYVDGQNSYIFTGEHANIINNLGKKIGPAKAAAKARLGMPKSFEVESMTRSYFNKVQEFVSSLKTRVMAKFVEGTPSQEVGLVISAKSNGKYGEKNFKFEVDDIFFEPIKKT